jgi:hypothetical protein
VGHDPTYREQATHDPLICIATLSKHANAASRCGIRLTKPEEQEGHSSRSCDESIQSLAPEAEEVVGKQRHPGPML